MPNGKLQFFKFKRNQQYRNWTLGRAYLYVCMHRHKQLQKTKGPILPCSTQAKSNRVTNTQALTSALICSANTHYLVTCPGGA